MGTQSWTQGDVIMFLCDVDIVFSTDFLERCRVNTKKGLKVFMISLFYTTKVLMMSLFSLPITYVSHTNILLV